MAILRDKRVRDWTIQILVVAGLAAAFLAVLDTTITNLRLRGIPLGFEFLSMPSGMPIAESLIAYTPDSPYSRAGAVGILNTIAVSAIVIVVSSVLGLFLGILRLSSNPAVAGAARIWVEIARNTPVIVILLFVYGVWTNMPSVAGAFEPLPGIFVSRRGVVLPTVSIELGATPIFGTLAGVLIVFILAARAATTIQLRTGRRPPLVGFAFLAIVGMIATASLAGVFEISVDLPTKGRFNFAGGTEVSPEFATLIVGLVFYTTGFIGEIARSGIVAVKKGYWEAALSLGLKHGQTLRLVVVPLALRVAVPPLNSQYINVVKNSTLAIAVGYQEFFTVAGTMINRTSHAIEGIAIILVTYLAVNLALSSLMNWYNRRLALVER
jgi:general L-amino acid transport system permease protein